LASIKVRMHVNQFSFITLLLTSSHSDLTEATGIFDAIGSNPSCNDLVIGQIKTPIDSVLKRNLQVTYLHNI